MTLNWDVFLQRIFHPANIPGAKFEKEKPTAQIIISNILKIITITIYIIQTRTRTHVQLNQLIEQKKQQLFIRGKKNQVDCSNQKIRLNHKNNKKKSIKIYTLRALDRRIIYYVLVVLACLLRVLTGMSELVRSNDQPLQTQLFVKRHFFVYL